MSGRRSAYQLDKISPLQKFTILFWNVARKNLSDALLTLASVHDPEIIVLCEASPPMFHLPLESLGFQVVVDPAFESTQKIVLFVQTKRVQAKSVHAEHPRFGIFKVEGFEDDLLVTGVHFIDKGSAEAGDDHLLACKAAQAIADTEDRLSIPNSIVIGDFNMNPWDPGVYGAKMFNARACRREIARQRGGLDRQRAFYNPVWNCLGDKSPGPPGSYYYRGGDFKWQTLDQVLLRPVLADRLESIEFLTVAGDLELLTTEGIPSSSHSDHLPLLVKLIQKEEN